MPAHSQAQAHYMGMVASGKIKKKGLSPSKAKEFLRGVQVSKLPKHSNKSAHASTPFSEEEINCGYKCMGEDCGVGTMDVKATYSQPTGGGSSHTEIDSRVKIVHPRTSGE